MYVAHYIHQFSTFSFVTFAKSHFANPLTTQITYVFELHKMLNQFNLSATYFASQLDQLRCREYAHYENLYLTRET